MAVERVLPRRHGDESGGDPGVVQGAVAGPRGAGGVVGTGARRHRGGGPGTSDDLLRECGPCRPTRVHHVPGPRSAPLPQQPQDGSRHIGGGCRRYGLVDNAPERPVSRAMRIMVPMKLPPLPPEPA